jgi:hypothetical protein
MNELTEQIFGISPHGYFASRHVQAFLKAVRRELEADDVRRFVRASELASLDLWIAELFLSRLEKL